MRKYILPTILIFILFSIVLITFFGMNRKEVLIKGEYTCNSDDDCISVSGGCCGCGGGGANIAINNESKEEYLNNQNSKCKDLACIAVVSDDPTCSAQPVCLDGICELIEK